MTSAVSAQVSAPCTMVTERPTTSGSEYPLSLSQPTDAMRIRKGGSDATISWQRVWSRAPSAGGAGGAGGWLLGIGCLRPLASIMFHLTGILQPPTGAPGGTGALVLQCQGKVPIYNAMQEYARGKYSGPPRYLLLLTKL